MALPVTQCAGAGCLRFFVFGLAVNDRRHTLAGIFADPFPNTHDVAASGIDNLASVILYLLQNGQLRSERWQDDNVVGLQFGDVGLFVSSGQILDAERGYLLVHFRVVNDFADDEEAAVRENFAGGVGEIDGALDTVTKSKLLRQSHGHITDGNDAAVASNPIDHIAAVM